MGTTKISDCRNHSIDNEATILSGRWDKPQIAQRLDGAVKGNICSWFMCSQSGTKTAFFLLFCTFTHLCCHQCSRKTEHSLKHRCDLAVPSVTMSNWMSSVFDQPPPMCFRWNKHSTDFNVFLDLWAISAWTPSALSRLYPKGLFWPSKVMADCLLKGATLFPLNDRCEGMCLYLKEYLWGTTLTWVLWLCLKCWRSPQLISYWQFYSVWTHGI